MKENSQVFWQKEVETLKAALNASYDGIHILDHEGRTVFINKACERIEGITEKDVEGKTISQLVEEGFYSEPITLRVLEEKKPVTRVQKVKNGTEVLATGTPIYDENGNVAHVIVNSRDITELTRLNRKLEEKARMVEKYHETLRKSGEFQDIAENIVVNSSRMHKIVATAVNIAMADSTVLLTGESGTGKSLFAGLIHENSRRSTKAFIKVDCAAIPESLFESELFGYEKGAFTGANQRGKTGIVELADGGSLFLDEIGEVPLSMQSKLLRLIQEKKFYKVGGERAVSVDIRIIAATNRDLYSMVKSGKFREDLYYRINVIPLEIPALRERQDDIAPLVIKFIQKYNDKNGENKKISNTAMDTIVKYSWPGNVRELENVLERMLVMSETDIIEQKDLPQNVNAMNSFADFDRSKSFKALMSEYECNTLKILIDEGRSPIEIAKMLSLDVTNVRRKLHKYGISLK